MRSRVRNDYMTIYVQISVIYFVRIALSITWKRDGKSYKDSLRNGINPLEWMFLLNFERKNAINSSILSIRKRSITIFVSKICIWKRFIFANRNFGNSFPIVLRLLLCVEIRKMMISHSRKTINNISSNYSNCIISFDSTSLLMDITQTTLKRAKLQQHPTNHRTSHRQQTH